MHFAYTPEQEALRREVRLTIADEGPGVGAAELGSIFEPFFRGAAARGTSGHGLGLAIAKKVVEDHGGEIYLDERCKTGTLFKIMIPFAVPKGEIPRMSLAPVSFASIPRRTL